MRLRIISGRERIGFEAKGREEGLGRREGSKENIKGKSKEE